MNNESEDYESTSLESQSTGPSYIDLDTVSICGVSTPSCSTPPSSSLTDSRGSSPSHVGAKQNNCESLLDLLHDDAPHVVGSNFGDSNRIISVQANSPPPPPDAHSQVVRLPQYVKAPARVFPVVIGPETYLLPYEFSSNKVVLGLNVMVVDGDNVIAKVVGFGSYQPDCAYPDILLTPHDEVKLIQATGDTDKGTEELAMQFRQDQLSNQSYRDKLLLQRQGRTTASPTENELTAQGVGYSEPSSSRSYPPNVTGDSQVTAFSRIPSTFNSIFGKGILNKNRPLNSGASAANLLCLDQDQAADLTILTELVIFL